MIRPIYRFDEPHRPPEGENNVWFADRNKDQVLVFVHGILSDSRSCWYRDPEGMKPGVYWPDLVQSDRRFSEYSIYLGGYYTAIDSGDYTLTTGTSFP
jgi:hypothetical protein